MMSETIDRRRVSLSRARCFAGVLLLLLLVSAGGECRAFGTPKTDEEYRQSVRELFAADKWGDGMVILEEGLKRYPESSELNELAGSYYYNLKNYDNARYYLVRAVKNAPDNVTAKSLLINVEEQTGNYSSAICYVNELLEVTPYWPGLWKRKIGLYRLQGDDAEADRLLKRLYDIYPNDTAVRRDYVSRLEENYLRQRKAGQKQEAIDNLQKLLEMSPRTEVYYLDLANLLLQLGDPEAALRVVAPRRGDHPLCRVADHETGRDTRRPAALCRSVGFPGDEDGFVSRSVAAASAYLAAERVCRGPAECRSVSDLRKAVRDGSRQGDAGLSVERGHGGRT